MNSASYPLIVPYSQLFAGAVLLPAVRPAALPRVDLAHVGPDRVVHDPVHDRDGWTPPRSSLS